MSSPDPHRPGNVGDPARQRPRRADPGSDGDCAPRRSRPRPPLAIRVHIDPCFLHCGKALLRARPWEPAMWGPRRRVSFGERYAERAGGDASVARRLDAAIEVDYHENLRGWGSSLAR